MRKQNNKCVYIHIRLDTGRVFYVGMGSCKRPYEKSKRNIHWKRVINKTDYEVKIIFENLTWEEACKLEIDTIYKYRRNDLTNMTAGGDGSKGCIPSVETRIKIGNYHRNKIVSSDSRDKMSIAKKDKYLLSNNPNSKRVINITFFF